MGHKVRGRKRQSTDPGCVEPALSGRLCPGTRHCPRPSEGRAGPALQMRKPGLGGGRDPSACHLAQGQSRAQGPGGCEGSTFTRRGAGSCRSRWEPAINTMLTPVTLASRSPAQAQGQNSRSRQPAAAPRSAGCSLHPNEVPHFLTGSALREALSWLSPKRGALRVKQATRPPAVLGRAGSDSPGRGPRV